MPLYAFLILLWSIAMAVLAVHSIQMYLLAAVLAEIRALILSVGTRSTETGSSIIGSIGQKQYQKSCMS